MPRVNFTPQANGFAFVNYWTFDEAENDLVLKALTTAGDDALTLLSPIFGPRLIFIGAGRVLANWINRAVPHAYGLCGGMAFAALDYFQAQQALPRGNGPDDQPTRATPAGTKLRTYLWKRMLDSLQSNVATVLAWMAVLHLIPAWWPFSGGAPWLLRESRKHWRYLKERIDLGQPWPIALIGTTKDPGSNHQVLAYGYDELSDGTGRIYVYDMNCPGGEREIAIDLRGRTLVAVENCPSPNRGPLQGFFCEAYAPVAPAGG